MVSFVQATYVLAMFVHISNISAVSDPILTKLFGPNFSGSKFLWTNIIFFGPNLFVDQQFCWNQYFLESKKIFRSKIFFGPISFFDQQFCGSKIISDPKIFWTQNSDKKKFRTQIFLNPQFFWTQMLLDPKFFAGLKFLWTQSLWTHDLFGPKIFFGPNICLGRGDYHWRQGAKPFQAEHLRLKPC